MDEEDREVFLRQFTINTEDRDWLSDVWFHMAYDTASELLAGDVEGDEIASETPRKWTQKQKDKQFEEYLENIWIGDGYDYHGEWLKDYASADDADLDKAGRILNNAVYKPQKSKKERKRKGDRLI